MSATTAAAGSGGNRRRDRRANAADVRLGDPRWPADARIGLRTRWSLRRQGRLDGRLGLPETAHAQQPTTTEMRSLLQREHEARLAEVRRQLARESTPHHNAITQLEARIIELDKQIADTRVQLAETERDRPDPAAAPRRHPGDAGRPDDLVRTRRDREYRRRLDAARAQLRQYEEQRRQAREQSATARGSIRRLHQTAVASAHRSRALFLQSQAIYEQALLRRHPDPDLLRMLLDRTEPELPEWTRLPPEDFQATAED